MTARSFGPRKPSSREVRHGAVGAASWRPGVAGTHGRQRREHAGQLREVDAAVLGDEDRAVGRERGAVRAAARHRDPLDRPGVGPHAEQRARGDARRDDGSVRTPHRTLRERDALADDDRLHHGGSRSQPPAFRDRPAGNRRRSDELTKNQGPTDRNGRLALAPSSGALRSGRVGVPGLVVLPCRVALSCCLVVLLCPGRLGARSFCRRAHHRPARHELGRGDAHTGGVSRRRAHRVHGWRTARGSRGRRLLRRLSRLGRIVAWLDAAGGAVGAALGYRRRQGGARGVRATGSSRARGASAVPISEWVMAAILAWAKRFPRRSSRSRRSTGTSRSRRSIGSRGRPSRSSVWAASARPLRPGAGVRHGRAGAAAHRMRRARSRASRSCVRSTSCCRAPRTSCSPRPRPRARAT